MSKKIEYTAATKCNHCGHVYFDNGVTDCDCILGRAEQSFTAGKMLFIPDGDDTALLERINGGLNTQDNRITADPIFCVYEKRPIVVDEDYDYDRIEWCESKSGDYVEATEQQYKRLEALHKAGREPKGWQRMAIKDIDVFVTACFTEQGCKDFLAIQGHNLRLPFIYVNGLFRNREMIGLRELLKGISTE